MASPRNKKGHFAKGNKIGIKLKDKKIRQEGYLSYCAHIARGKSKKSWYFEHPDHSCTWQTMEKYILDEAEFNPIHKEIAWSKGYAKWEQVVEDSAEGKNKDANTASLQMLMRNKYEWDKENSVQKETTEPLVKAIAKMWRNK